MAVFKFCISDPETRRTYQLEVEQTKALALIGKRIGEEFAADFIGLPGYKLKVTGGTDKDGFPMHPAVKGPGKHRVLLSMPPCFRPKLKGQRKRKTVRGNVISEDIKQINCKVVEKGEKPLEEIIPRKEKRAEKPKLEKPKEAEPERPKPKEETKEEVKKKR